MIKKPPETYRAFVDRLADLFDQIPPETVEEAEQELRDAGFDPEAVGQRMKILAEQTLARSRLNWRINAAEERGRVVDKLTHFVARVPEARSELETAIRQILERSPQFGNLPAVTAHFRNFAEATDEDLKSLLFELEFLHMQAEEDSKDKEK
jgi:hypothetical protein